MMKRLFAVAAMALLTLPALAEEKEKTEKKAAKQEAAAKAPAAPAAPAVAPAAAESPIVAAARRAGRSKSKTVVITDDMIKKSTGHISTTDSDYLPPSLPEKIEPSSEVVHNEAVAKTKAEEEKKAAEAKAAEEKEKLRLARLAERAEQLEDGYPDDEDPAQVERELAEEAKKQQEAQQQEEKKP